MEFLDEATLTSKALPTLQIVRDRDHTPAVTMCSLGCYDLIAKKLPSGVGPLRVACLPLLAFVDSLLVTLFMDDLSLTPVLCIELYTLLLPAGNQPERAAGHYSLAR